MRFAGRFHARVNESTAAGLTYDQTRRNSSRVAAVRLFAQG